MRIRDLDGSRSEMNIISDEQGDVYVTITNLSKRQELSVRVGGAGSGHFIPPKVRNLLLQLADEFNHY